MLMVGRRRLLDVLASFAIAVAVLVAVPGSVPAAHAAVLEVGITGCDDVAGAPYCTISAAIAAAAPDDIIDIVEDGTYIDNVTVDRNVTITGSGMGLTIVDGDGVGRVFDIEAGVTATITDLDIVNGDAPDGGGIQVQAGASLTATAVTVSGNSATALGFSDGRGGGIYVPDGGQLTLNGGSVVSDNTADLFGMGAYLVGSFEDAIVVTETTFDNNDHPTDKAGGLWLQATCEASCGARQILIEASTFSNNDTQNGGGGIWANADTGNEIQITNVDFIDNTAACPVFDGGCGEGGALVVDNGSGLVAVADSRFFGNIADFWGGAIANYGNMSIVDSVFGAPGAPGALANRMDSVDPSFSPGGGAIAHVGDTMTISGTSIEGNSSDSDAGAIYTEGTSLSIDGVSRIADNVAAVNGGGIYASGPISVTDTTLESNSAGDAGGGIYTEASSDVALDNVTIDSNVATAAGGGIFTDGGAIVITGSDFLNNGAASGAAIYLDPGPGFVQGTVDINAPTSCVVAPDIASFVPLTTFVGNNTTGGGGAIYADGEMNIFETLFSNNDADDGGAIYVESGADPITVGCSAFELNDAIADGGAIGGQDDGLVTITDTLFDANTAGDLGGALVDPFGGLEFDVAGSIFTNNTAIEGGAIYTEYDLSVVTSVFAGNSATETGGAVFRNSSRPATFDTVTVDGNTAEDGGGLYLRGSGDFTISNSTISNNTATSTAFTAVGGLEGSNGSVENTTISGNQAPNGGVGGAYSAGNIELNNVTVTNNSDLLSAGGLSTGESVFWMANTIVAGNSSSSGRPDCNAFIASRGYNVVGIDDDECIGSPLASDQIGSGVAPVDPLFGPLADNGGPTLTHELLAGSPAIDTGNTVININTPAFDPGALAGYQLNGDAAGDADNLVLAAPNSPAGSAFYADTFSTTDDFSAQFDFEIVTQEGDGADGFTFTITDDPTALGVGGGFLGLSDGWDPIDTVHINPINGVSVEFDTWPNGSGEGANDPGGSPPDHIGIDLDGDVSSIVQTSSLGDFSNDAVWTVWIDYDANNTRLDVRASTDGIRPASATLSDSIDMGAQFGGSPAYIGFTGTTGIAGIAGEQRILNFSLASTGACAAADQRGVLRPIGESCDAGAYEAAVVVVPGELSVNLAIDGAIAGSEPIFSIDDLDIGTFFGSGGAPSSTQLGAIQLGAIQLGAIAGTGLTAAGGHLTIGSIIEAAGELSAVPTILDEITLVDVSIVGGWDSILALSNDLAGRPPYTVSLQSVIDDASITAALNPPLEEFRLADSGVSASQLGAIQLGAIQLGAIQLGAIDPAGAQLGAIGAQLAGLRMPAGAVDCAALGINPADSSTYDDEYSIMALTLLGVDLDFAQLGAIQLGAIDAGSLQDIQLGAIQLGAIDLNALTIGNTQLGAIQLGAIQLGAITLGAAQLGAIGTKADLIDFWCNDPAGGLNCTELGLDTNAGFAGDELDGYSILALGAMGADLGALQLGAIQLGAIGGLDSTQLGAIQLGAIGDVSAAQLGAIQLGAIQLGAIQLGAIDYTSPAVAQLGAIQLGAIQLGAINADGSLTATQLGAIQLGAIQLGAIDNVVNCSTLAGGCEANATMSLLDLDQAGLLLDTATLADLAGAIGAIPLQVLADQGFDIVALVGAATLADLLPETTISELPPDLTLGDLAELWVGIPVYELLLALLDPADLSWEDVDAATLAAENPIFSAGFSVGFELTGDLGGVPEAEFPFTADVSVTLPSGVTYTPGSSALAVEPTTLPPTNSVALSDPTLDGATLRWIIEGIDLNEFQYLQFELNTAFTADTTLPISATVDTLGRSASDDVPTVVTDVEPNDTFAQATSVAGDVLVLGRIDPGADVDIFELENLPVGASIEVYLNPGGSDLDLVLFEPGTASGPELRGPAERIVDGSLDPTIGIDPTEQDQESLDDIANTDVAPVFKASLHRNDASERIVTPPLREAGSYFVQISGYQLPQPSDVYVGRIKVVLPPDAGACAARPLAFDGQGVAGTLPVIPAGTETVYLLNQELFADTYGPAALNNVLASIQTAHSNVASAPSAVVIPVEGDAAVAGAYTDWLSATGNCSVDAANIVAQQIATLVDGYRAAEPSIASVVIVGGDDQVPFFRLPDQTTIANEREYETTFSGNNPLDAALRGGYVLTDAPMVDFNPLYVEQGDREIFVGQIPVGRLVEEPAEIVATMNQYEASGGLLDMANAGPNEARVLGYDFLADSSATIAAALAAQGFSPVVGVVNEVWDKAAIQGAFDSGAAVINANAHYDHTAALPAAGNASGSFNNLYTVDDLAPLPSSLYAGAVIYTMGCHAGLNAPGAYLDPSDDLYDWTQALLGRQAIYIANTGFGYGDSDFQAYSEEFMALLTEQFATSNSIGEAYTYAAQLFAAQTPKWSPYHDKALMEATLYGLPFYALRTTPLTPPPIPTVPTAPVPGGGDLESSSINATSNAGGGFLQEQTAATGDRYFSADDVLAVPFRPVQPLEYIDATPANGALTIRGAIIETGSSSDVPNFDVLYARPILYDQDSEPEFETTGAFPNALQAVTSYQLPNGRADRVLLARGRYFPSVQTQQNWDEAGLTVYYAPGAPADVTPPKIALVAAVDQGGDVDFTVEATDGSGVLRVLVLYKVSGASGAWTPLELSGPVGATTGTWTASAAIAAAAGNIDYWVQVLGSDGQVASSTDKAELHDVLPPGPPTLTFAGTLGNNGIYRSSVTVAATPPSNSPSAAIEISTDGGATFVPYSSPISVSGDGPFTVTARLVDFSQVATSKAGTVDAAKPSITVVDPTGSIEVGLGAPLPLRYFCNDTQSGIAKCKGTVVNGGLLDTSVAGSRTAQVTATDRAGNVRTVLVPYTVSEVDPVTVTVDANLVPIDSFVTFTAHPVAAGSTVEWWFGDGNSFVTGESADLIGTDAIVTHPYTGADVYPVTVRVTNANGLSQIGTFNFVVVYDPAGGFVTGSGWFFTPAGAYTPEDPDDAIVTGKAHFGFSSKYKKGATVPTGTTNFKLDANGFKFKSTSLEWLVVSGKAKAQYQGVGTIKGMPGEYQFRITLRDADGNDNDAFTEDAIRVRIWAEGGAVIYDNAHGLSDQTTHGGTQPIDGGSIVIHVPRGNKRS